MISVFIFTSNNFRPWKIEERERERERARRSPCRSKNTNRSHRSKTIAPLRSFKPTLAEPSHRSSRSSRHFRTTRKERDRERKKREQRDRRTTGEIVSPSFSNPLAPDFQRTHSHHADRTKSHCVDEPTTLTNPFVKPTTLTNGFSFTQIAPLMNFFWLGFVWKLRKCEEQEKNVFSILSSATQPNTRKYFPMHFLECNQTLVNIFLSEKQHFQKINIFRKIFYMNQTQPQYQALRQYYINYWKYFCGGTRLEYGSLWSFVIRARSLSQPRDLVTVELELSTMELKARAGSWGWV